MKIASIPTLISSLLIATTLSTGVAQAESLEGYSILERIKCMRDNFPTSVGIRRITFTTEDRSGSVSEVGGRVYATRVASEKGRDLLRATLAIDSPPNLAGAAYLIRETDDYLRDGMFVYFPAIERVRRISGNVANRSLMGTAFSNFDFKQVANAFGDMKAELLDSDEVAGRTSHIILFKPVEGAETEYSSVLGWVDQESCVLIRADFMKGDQVLKRMNAVKGGIVKTPNGWYLSQLKMTDFQSGISTTLKVDQVALEEELSSHRFNPRTFYQTK